MREQRYSLFIRGRQKEWAFPIWAKPEHVKEWREDGLIVDEIQHEMPQWAVRLGLSGLWTWLEERLL